MKYYNFNNLINTVNNFYLKSKNVQDCNGGHSADISYGGIDAFNEPREQRRIQRFGYAIPAYKYRCFEVKVTLETTSYMYLQELNSMNLQLNP